MRQSEDEELQTKSELTVGAPGDRYEREADSVADRVTAMPDPALQRQELEDEEAPEIESQVEEEPEVQGQFDDEDESVQAKGETVPVITPQMKSELNTSRGGGEPLSGEVRSFMEPRFGRDFSSVRVHTGSRAASLAKGLRAQAFTRGSDVYFGSGKYAPNTASGKRLVAHELAHTVQQKSAPAKAPPGVSTKGYFPSTRETGTVQRAPADATATVEKVGETAPETVNIKGMTEFKSDAVAKWLETRPTKTGKVNVRFGKIAEGTLNVTKEGEEYSITKQAIPLTHPIFAGIPEETSAFQPSLIITTKGRNITGFVGVRAGAGVPESNEDLANKIKETPELIGLVGFRFETPPIIVNALEGGSLKIGLKEVPILLGSAFSGKFNVEANDVKVTTFGGEIKVSAKGLQEGTLKLKRSKEGLITGKVSVGLELPKNITGEVNVEWDGRAITGEGKVGYQGEKFSGDVTLRLMEKSKAAALEKAKKSPEETDLASPETTTTKRKYDNVDYVVFGEGDLTFAFVDWLTGTAHVIVDSKGFITVIGKITPQKEFELFPQNDYNKKLFYRY